MAGELATARAGLKTRLETISGLTVSLYGGEPLPPPPMAIILQDQGPRLLTFSGNSFRARFRVRVYLSHPGTEAEGWTELEKYTEQVEAKSVIAAVLADRTLNASVDVAQISLGSIGKATLDDQGPLYYSAEFLVDVFKKVA